MKLEIPLLLRNYTLSGFPSSYCTFQAPCAVGIPALQSGICHDKCHWNLKVWGFENCVSLLVEGILKTALKCITQGLMSPSLQRVWSELCLGMWGIPFSLVLNLKVTTFSTVNSNNNNNKILKNNKIKRRAKIILILLGHPFYRIYIHLYFIFIIEEKFREKPYNTSPDTHKKTYVWDGNKALESDTFCRI